jgi:outer membrane protein assembly factor BamB
MNRLRLFLPFLIAAFALAADWARWRGPNGDGSTPEVVNPAGWSADGPPALWKAKVGVGFASVTVAGDRAYTLGNADKSDTTTLWCLDTAKGAVVWKREWASPLAPLMYEGGPNASAVVDGAHLFTVIKPSRVVCLKAADGSPVWEQELTNAAPAGLTPWGVIGSPLVAGDKLIVTHGTLGTALDKATGKLLWTTGAKPSGFNTPVPATVKGEPSLLVFGTNQVAAVKLADGQPQWSLPFGEGYFCHSADPLVSGSTVYFGSADHGGLVLDFAGGEPKTLWKGRQMGNFMVGSVKRDGFLYGINHCDAKSGPQLRCVGWDTGEVKWEEKGFGSGSVTLAGDKLLILSDKGELTVAKASPEKFELLTRFQAIGGKCWTPPTLANGRLLLRNAAGDVVCFTVAPDKAG